MRDELAQWIGEQLGATVDAAELRRITTGHSRGNWFLELDDGSRFVVRIEHLPLVDVVVLERYEFAFRCGPDSYALLRSRAMTHSLEHHLAAEHQFHRRAKLPRCSRGEWAVRPWKQLAAKA